MKRRHVLVMRAVVAGAVGATAVALLGTGCSDSSGDGPKVAGRALKDSTGVDWIVSSDPKTGALTFVAPKNGPFALSSAGSPVDQATLSFLDVHKATFKMHDPRVEFVLDGIDRSGDGTSHVHFHQQVSGIPAFGGSWTAHFDAASGLTSMSGNYVLDAYRTPTVPTVGADAAAVAAKDEAAKRYPSVPLSDFRTSAPELEVFPVSGAAPVLAWSVTVDARTATTRVVLNEHVDAKIGAVLLASSGIRHRTATGAAAQTYPPYNVETPPVTFPVSDDEPPTLDGKGPGGVEMRVITRLRPNEPVVSTGTNPWTDATTPPGAAISAQAHAKIVLDYYAEHQWGPDNGPYLSFDGKGHRLTAVINHEDPESASWDPVDLSMSLGDGVPEKLVWPMSASLDTVAHEFAHGVTQFTSRLLHYSGGSESAAIDESMADIFAALITHRIRNNDADDFVFSEDDNNGHVPLRSMIQPTSSLLREGGGYSDLASVRAGNRIPHRDSNLPSHAFYLLTHGDVHAITHVKVPCGIGWEAADRLYWRLQTSYLERTETYDLLALHSLAAARELGIQAMPIACAWVAVGVLTADEAKNDWNVTCELDASGGGAGASDNSLVGAPVQLIECSVSLTGESASLTQ